MTALRPPFETFKDAYCRGSYSLGSACGLCERCAWEREQMAIGDTKPSTPANFLSAIRTDTERLDWLDSVNRKTNERNRTKYGWKFDINHNRATLTDNNFPHVTIREAIDEAIDKANAVAAEEAGRPKVDEQFEIQGSIFTVSGVEMHNGLRFYRIKELPGALFLESSMKRLQPAI